MEPKGLISLLAICVIMISFIPCLATQQPEDDETDSDTTGAQSQQPTHTRNRDKDNVDDGDTDLEGPYTFNRGHHRRNNDRKSGGLRHGDRRPDHRASSHEHNRGRTTSSKEYIGGTGSNSNRGRCPSGSFMNRTSGVCVTCSSCPINQIIRRPCSAHRDTVCGPFYEFQQQQNDQQHHTPIKASDANPSLDKARLKNAGKFEKSGIHGGDEAAHSINTNDDGVGQTRGPTVQSNADQWRELCYGLIGALAVVTLLALIYIIITQIQARRHNNKYPDTHCRTVLTPTMRVFANGFLGTTDYQKITPHFEDGTSRRPQNWFLRHLKRSLASQSQPNSYVMEGDVIFPLGAVPEAVEMDRLHQVIPHRLPTPPPPGDQVHGQDEQGQAAAAAADQGQEQDDLGNRLPVHLETTQSWDSGIGTHDRRA